MLEMWKNLFIYLRRRNALIDVTQNLNPAQGHVGTLNKALLISA